MTAGAPRLLRLQDQRPEAWKNGLGVSWTIAQGQPAAPGDKPDWHFSRAAIIREASIDVPPGHVGWLLLVQGEGGAIRFGNRPAIMVRRPLLPIRYVATESMLWKPSGGASTVLHLHLDPARATADVAVLGATPDAPEDIGDALLAETPGGPGGEHSDRRITVRLDATQMLRLTLKETGR